MIYDEVGSYAERLVGYLESKEGISVIRFTKTDKLEEHIEMDGNELYILQDTQYCRGIVAKYKLNAYLLTEDVNMEKSELVNYIYRYKSAPEIFNIIESKFEDKTDRQKEGITVAAMISPFNELYVDNILLEMIMKEKARTLIIDFRSDSMWDMILMNSEIILSDILFLARDTCERVANELDKAVINYNGADVIHGMSSRRDILEVTSKDLDTLVTVASMKGYQKVIMVFPLLALDTDALRFMSGNVIMLCSEGEKDNKLLGNIIGEANIDAKVYKYKSLSDELTATPDEYMAKRGHTEIISKVVEELRTDGII